MSKPQFVYTLACESCGETLTTTPQSQVVITDLKRQHAAKHERKEAALLKAMADLPEPEERGAYLRPEEER